MAVVVTVVAPPEAKTKRASKIKSTSRKKQFDCKRCLRDSIVVILFFFIIIHSIVSFVQVTAGMVIQFLTDEDMGKEGFTFAPWLRIVGITHFEHQEWELPSKRPYHEDSPEDSLMLQIRYDMISNCSSFSGKRKKKSNYHADCLDAAPDSKEENYFCAIIENPDKFNQAYSSLISLWLTFNFIYFLSTPLFLFAFVWQNQCIRLLALYVLIQLSPMFISVYVVYALWITHGYTLCGLDYMYNYFPTRLFFSLLLAAQLLAKIIEIWFIVWFIYLVNVEREQRGFGIKRHKYKVAAERPVIFKNEVLQPARHEEDLKKRTKKRSTGRLSIRSRISISDVKSNKDMEEDVGLEPRSSSANKSLQPRAPSRIKTSELQPHETLPETQREP